MLIILSYIYTLPHHSNQTDTNAIPVFQFHQIYSTNGTGIGYLVCIINLVDFVEI